jgi:hypothetical protein
MPQPADKSVEGTVESAPIRLDGYYASDFRCLLKVLLPLYVDHHRRYMSIRVSRSHHSQYRDKVDLSPEEWKSVLKLASAWEFSALRDAAIEQLSKVKELDLIEKLIIAVRFHIDAWTLDTLNALAKRETPLSLSEVERLLPVVGLGYIVKIAQVREDISNVAQTVPGRANHNIYCQTCNANRTCMGSQYLAQGSRAQRDFTAVIQSVFGLPQV